MELQTMYKSTKAIFEELQITSIPIRLKTVVAKGHFRSAIELYNNYSIRDKPPDEDIKKLARFFGKEEEGPTWYFSAKKWRWR
jgi:hypothetical protein